MHSHLILISQFKANNSELLLPLIKMCMLQNVFKRVSVVLLQFLFQKFNQRIILSTKAEVGNFYKNVF